MRKVCALLRGLLVIVLAVLCAWGVAQLALRFGSCTTGDHVTTKAVVAPAFITERPPAAGDSRSPKLLLLSPTIYIVIEPPECGSGQRGKSGDSGSPKAAPWPGDSGSPRVSSYI
jgi:hypothetical protein